MNETPDETLALLPHRLRSSAMILEGIADAIRTTVNHLPIALHGNTIPQIAATATFLDLIAALQLTHARQISRATRKGNSSKGQQEAAKSLSQMPVKAFHHA